MIVWVYVLHGYYNILMLMQHPKSTAETSNSSMLLLIISSCMLHSASLLILCADLGYFNMGAAFSISTQSLIFPDCNWFLFSILILVYLSHGRCGEHGWIWRPVSHDLSVLPADNGGGLREADCVRDREGIRGEAWHRLAPKINVTVDVSPMIINKWIIMSALL